MLRILEMLSLLKGEVMEMLGWKGPPKGHLKPPA